MADIFLKILNMSISAGWLVLAVLVLRVILKKAPKWINSVLWGIVGLRLIMPISFESVLSLIPSAETVSKEPNSPRPYFESGVIVVDNQVNDYLKDHYFEGVTRPTGYFIDVTTVLAVVWFIGIIALLIYALVSYIRLKNTVATAVLLRENIYQCEKVSTPFVLGIIKPWIYLPFNITKDCAEYVIAHERAHIKRKDHLWKPLGFLLLTLHWFNPLMWLGYVLLCRDIELACDEKVVKEFSNDQKADYSQALLSCSVNRKIIAACPLAFGEVGVKNRVKSVLSYKRPAIWLMAVAVIVSIAVAVCFLTNPKTKKRQSDNYTIYCNVVGAECDNIVFEYIYGTLNKDYPYICVNWTNNTEDELCFGNEFAIYKDGKLYEPKEEIFFDLLLYSVKSGKSKSENYALSSYELKPNESYVLEKSFYLKSNPDRKYKAFIKFSVKGIFSFAGKQYAGEKIIYENGSFSSIIYTNSNIPQFMVSEQDLELLTTNDNSLSSAWKRIDGLQRIALKKSNFDELFTAEIWEDGYSAAQIRKNNLNAFSANTLKGTWYYLLEQKNGDIYIAQSDGVTSNFRWLFKMREVDKTVISEKINENAFKQPPEMAVISSNAIATVALQMTSSWTYINSDGQAVGLEADSMNPLLAKEHMPKLDTLPDNISLGVPETVSILFNAKDTEPICRLTPDKVYVRCWSDKSWGNVNAEYQEFSVDVADGDFYFELKNGNYIYEVVATWNSSAEYNGTVHYAFYTAKPD